MTTDTGKKVGPNSIYSLPEQCELHSVIKLPVDKNTDMETRCSNPQGDATVSFKSNPHTNNHSIPVVQYNHGAVLFETELSAQHTHSGSNSRKRLCDPSFHGSPLKGKTNRLLTVDTARSSAFFSNFICTVAEPVLMEELMDREVSIVRRRNEFYRPALKVINKSPTSINISRTEPESAPTPINSGVVTLTPQKLVTKAVV